MEVKRLKSLDDGTYIFSGGGKCFRARFKKCLTKCLPPIAIIDTPEGGIPIAKLHKGHPVWTRSATGKKLRATVLYVQRIHVGPAHEIIQVKLTDGRMFSASPGHPLATVGTVGQLQPGDFYDFSRVKEVTILRHLYTSTFDILPSGETGIYWADGVALGSTLINQ